MKQNTCSAAAYTNLKIMTRLSSSYLERPTCTLEDGQLGRNAQCVFAIKRRKVTNNQNYKQKKNVHEN
jgi:hypothetical protein